MSMDLSPTAAEPVNTPLYAAVLHLWAVPGKRNWVCMHLSLRHCCARLCVHMMNLCWCMVGRCLVSSFNSCCCFMRDGLNSVRMYGAGNARGMHCGRSLAESCSSLTPRAHNAVLRTQPAQVLARAGVTGRHIHHALHVSAGTRRPTCMRACNETIAGANPSSCQLWQAGSPVARPAQPKKGRCECWCGAGGQALGCNKLCADAQCCTRHT